MASSSCGFLSQSSLIGMVVEDCGVYSPRVFNAGEHVDILA